MINKVLLMGYNGANNTGSETRLISIIEDVRILLGPEVVITIPTLNEKNLRRYISEDSNLRIVPIPSIYFFAIRKLVKKHDLVLLVEGSCYMDTWTSALLWAFLWTTQCAYFYNVPCVAYAVDAGDLSRLNRFLVRNIASKTDLIITRTIHAANILKNMGVSAPIVHTADCAFTFKTEPKDEEILLQIWKNKSLPEVKNGFVGMAIIDFYLWPVVIRPWGKRENLYKWPYYFSRSKDRIIGSEKLAEKWASEADRIIEQYGKNIVIICMEEVDEPLAHKIIGKMKNSENAIITSSKEFNASQMTEILRSLELLITSRYHAAVLSLENTVPQLAVGHDPRLKGLYKDLKIDENYLIDYLSEKNAWQLIWSQLSKKVDYLLENPEKVHERLYNGYIEHLKRSKKNKNILKELLIRKGWDVSS
jgi:polysaccharide pyruvyl transferase WcaK-like protein